MSSIDWKMSISMYTSSSIRLSLSGGVRISVLTSRALKTPSLTAPNSAR